MKTKFLLACALSLASSFYVTKAKAQSSTSPDTVCAGKAGVPYHVSKTPGSTFYWTVPNGTIASGNNTDSITVNWSSTPGTDIISVVEINSHGCIGDTQKLTVFRMPLPTASLTGADSLCYNNTGTSFAVSFTGIGPWNFTYSDGTHATSLTNISSNPYTINTGSLSSSTTYTITAISNKFGCSGTASGTGMHVVIVNPKPATSPIYHN